MMFELHEWSKTMRSEPGLRAPVAIHAFRGPGRGLGS